MAGKLFMSFEAFNTLALLPYQEYGTLELVILEAPTPHHIGT